MVTKRKPKNKWQKRGPKARPPGTTTTPGQRRNVTLPKVEANALSSFQQKLSDHLGIGVRLTLSQSLRWLLDNGEKLLEAQAELRKKPPS